MNDLRAVRARKAHRRLAAAAGCVALLVGAVSCGSDANDTPATDVIVPVSDATPASLGGTGSPSTAPASANTAVDSPSTDTGAPAGDRGGSLVPNGG